MKARKIRQHIRIAGVLGVTAVISLVLGHGCSDFKAGSGSLGSLACGAGAGIEDIQAQPGERTVSLVYGSVVLDNMVACTGIQQASLPTQEEWERRSGSLSEYGYATEVTAPMMMAIAAIAGEVCNDLVNQEVAATTPRIFASIDLNGAGGTVTNSAVEESVKLMARSCWQRDESDEERGLIVNAINGVISDGGNARDAALSLCTAMLSSLSAIEM